jgi:hypothetical protein
MIWLKYHYIQIKIDVVCIIKEINPMKDTPEEIASVMNLILPKNFQLPVGDKFISKYLDKYGENKFTVKKNKINELKTRFKGRVSFLKSMRTSVKKEFVGDKNVGKLKHLIVETVTMSKFQTKAYIQAVALDEKGKAGVHYNTRQASLMVFPDGSYGQPRIEGTNNVDRSKGFEKYVKSTTSSKTFTVSNLLGKSNKTVVKSYTLTNELIDSITGDTKKYNIKNLQTDSLNYKNIIQTRLKNLRKYSTKYSNVIESMLNAKDESCFVYSELVTGSGSILFSQLLLLFGFSQATGKEGNTTGLRFGFLTSDSTSTQIHKIIKTFNQPANKFGNIIKVIIGSKVVSEGVSFYNVQREYILTPWYNYSETDQAIARGYRLGSHKELLKYVDDPIVRVSQLVAMPLKNNIFSIDLNMYETSEDKDITIRGILRYMMEASFDCSLNYFRNHTTGYDGQRDCEYQKCDYICDGINMKNIEDGLPIQEIDNSTYQLYYSDPKVLPIRKDLEKYFRQHNELEISNIITYFEGKYTKWEIDNALKSIIKKTDKSMYYTDYVKIYSRSNINKIILQITQLFSTHFRVGLETITSILPTYTTFEVLTALKNMIDESIVIKNKYGFSSYLREDKNIYFLVNNLSISNDSFSDYYVRIPNIVNEKSFNEILNDVQIENLPTFIKILCGVVKEETFSKLIRSIPDDVQELFIEAAIEARDKNIVSNQTTIKLVLNYFLNYIHQIDDVWVSNRLKDDDIIKCYKDGIWNDCGEEYEELIEDKIKDRKNNLEQNPWGYYGQYNPETGVFSMVNIIAQKEKQAEIKQKEKEKLKILVDKGKITQEEMDDELIAFIAGREIYPGRNCKQGWGIHLLIRMAVKTIKLDYPKTFKKNESDSQIRKLLKDDKYIGKGSKKDKPIYTHDEIDKLSKEDLRRALYWSIRKPGGYIKVLCEGLEKWFRSTKWEGLDMLIPDKQAGTSGGHKKILSKNINKKLTELQTQIIIPEQNQDKFKKYLKDIQILMEECFKIKKYIPSIDDKRWIIVFSNKKIVGFLAIDKNNLIWNVCVSNVYRKRGIAQHAIQTAVNNICPESSPRLLIDNKGKNYKSLIKLYTSYGFTFVKNDDKITTMEFKCKLIK